MNIQLVITYLVLILLGVVNMIRGIIFGDLFLTVIFAILAIIGLLSLRDKQDKSNN